MAGFLEHLGDDARDLRLNQDLVARLHIARGHGLGLDRPTLGRHDFILDHFGLRLLPQKYEGAYHGQSYYRKQDDSLDLLYKSIIHKLKTKI